MRSRVAVCLLAAVLVSTACRRSDQKRIAVIPKSTSHEFWVAAHEGALKAGREFNVEILWNGPAQETDYSRQIQIVDSMVAQHVDGIALAAAERKALVGPVDRAIAEGIPVTIFDSGLDSTNYTSYVATDNVEGGRLAAHTLAKLLNGKGDVALLMHVPGSQSSMDREQGFREVIGASYPGIHIVASQYGMSDRARARSAAENMLAAHPGLAGMFASAEPSSLGAALALKGRSLVGKVKLVTFDSSDQLRQDLQEGVIDAMVVQDPQRIGYEAVRTLVERLKGNQPPKRIDLNATVVRKSGA